MTTIETPGAASTPPGQTPREYRIDIPPGTVLLNLNNERSMHHMKRYRIVEAIKEQAGWHVRAQRIPRLERVEAYGLLHVPDRHRRDPGNWAPTQKAAIDALVRLGVLADDDAEILTDLGIRRGDIGRPLAYSLIIREVAA